ncbi:hypothetical protein [Nonomuraea wenchangensis]|uniref:hypothetical protein n=1 Tax=Nonomuraea wenchangensis TaxID=568860 RepID=UPI00331B9538
MPAGRGGQGARAAQVGHVVVLRGEPALLRKHARQAEHVELRGDPVPQGLGQAAVEHVRVRVDQPRQERPARTVHLGVGGVTRAGADRGDQPALDHHVGPRDGPLAVEHPDVADQRTHRNISSDVVNHGRHRRGIPAAGCDIVGSDRGMDHISGVDVTLPA